MEMSQELQEIMAKGRTDIVLFADKLLGMSLHGGQITFLNQTKAQNKKINILTCANRWGKSTIIAIIQIHALFYKLGIAQSDEDDGSWDRVEYRTANIAPHSANTEAVFKAIHQIMTSSFSITDPTTGKMTTNNCVIEWFYLKDRTLNTPPYKQFFEGNCYIEHRSLGGDQGDALQGKPYGLITYDEGGRSNHLELEIRGGILPRLFDWNGPLYIMSTPDSNSKSSLYYYQMYKDGLIGLNNTLTMTGSLRDNTFFTKEQIQAQYDLYKNDPLRDQVLEGKFVFGGNTLFDSESILDAQDDSLNEPIKYEDGHRYCIGIDTAIGSDEMVYSVIDITSKPYRQVNQVAVKGNSKSPQMHLFDLMYLIDMYNRDGNVYIMLETWNGESARFYLDLPPQIQAITETYGSWSPTKLVTDNENPLKTQPNASKKSDILISLKKLLSARELKIPKLDTKLTDQLAIYREDDSKLQTDRLMALALACHRASELAEMITPEWASIEW